MRILILGGTSEAFTLAQRLVNDRRFSAIYSLAGRTAAPQLPPVPYRIGGFGGPQGLAAWLAKERIEAIVDATHPFAARISANAAEAARQIGLPLLFVQRPPWEEDGDGWMRVPDMAQAAAVLGAKPAKVFLAIGRLELGAFRTAPQHSYLVRAVDTPAPEMLPPRANVLLQRGPFELEAECDLLRTHAIEFIVSKNSGGAAAYAKIAAARQLSTPVVMVERPPLPAGGASVAGVDAALAWLNALLPEHHGTVASERGV